MESCKNDIWISIYEELPRKEQIVVTAFGDGTTHVDKYMPGHILSYTSWWNLKNSSWEKEYADHRILYWMPLPDAPKISSRKLSINAAMNICNTPYEGNDEQMLSAVSTVIDSGNLHELSRMKIEKLLTWTVDKLTNFMRRDEQTENEYLDS